MKLIEILNLNRELLIYLQKAGIRLDDVQYIDLFKEYRTLSAHFPHKARRCHISWQGSPQNMP